MKRICLALAISLTTFNCTRSPDDCYEVRDGSCSPDYVWSYHGVFCNEGSCQLGDVYGCDGCTIKRVARGKCEYPTGGGK